MILRRQMPLLAQEHRPIWQADLAAGQSLKEASYHYLVTDHLGAPVLALNKAGETTWKARYEAFGKARIENASTAQINLRLPGQYFDAETGLHQNWNRDYAPGIGRYIQADPIGLAGGLNVYQYAYGNPMVYIDTEGRLVQVLAWRFIGGALEELTEQAIYNVIMGCNIFDVDMGDIMVSGLFGMVGLPGIEDGVKAVFRGKKAIPPELPKGSSKRAQKRRRAEVKKIERLNNETQKWKESVYNGIIMGFIIDHAIADYLKDSNGDTKNCGR